MQVGVAISHSSRPNFCCCPIFVNIPGKFETHSNKIRHPQPPNANFCCCTALIDKSEDSTFRRVFKLFQNFYTFKTLIISLFLFLFLFLLLYLFHLLYFFIFQSRFFCFFFSPNFVSLFFFFPPTILILPLQFLFLEKLKSPNILST